MNKKMETRGQRSSDGGVSSVNVSARNTKGVEYSV